MTWLKHLFCTWFESDSAHWSTDKDERLELAHIHMPSQTSGSEIYLPKLSSMQTVLFISGYSLTTKAWISCSVFSALLSNVLQTVQNIDMEFPLN